MERKALYAGSFDPITVGHLNIIERAARMYDSLTVVVAVNVNKKSFFTQEERLDSVRKVTSHIPNVEVVSYSGLLADYINENGFTAYVRGLRNSADFLNEIQMAQMNSRLLTEGTEIVFLMTEPEHSFISSSLVKEVVLSGGSAEGLVPAYVIQMINNKLLQEEL